MKTEILSSHQESNPRGTFYIKTKVLNKSAHVERLKPWENFLLYCTNYDVRKVKEKLTLCLTKHHAVETYWGMEVRCHTFLTSWSASHPDCFTPGERVPSTYWIGGWVGLRTSLDAVEKRKIPSLCQVSPSQIPIIQPVACTNCAISALYHDVIFHKIHHVFTSEGISAYGVLSK